MTALTFWGDSPREFKIRDVDTVNASGQPVPDDTLASSMNAFIAAIPPSLSDSDRQLVLANATAADATLTGAVTSLGGGRYKVAFTRTQLAASLLDGIFINPLQLTTQLSAQQKPQPQGLLLRDEFLRTYDGAPPANTLGRPDFVYPWLSATYAVNPTNGWWVNTAGFVGIRSNAAYAANLQVNPSDTPSAEAIIDLGAVPYFEYKVRIKTAAHDFYIGALTDSTGAPGLFLEFGRGRMLTVFVDELVYRSVSHTPVNGDVWTLRIYRIGTNRYYVEVLVNGVRPFAPVIIPTKGTYGTTFLALGFDNDATSEFNLVEVWTPAAPVPYLIADIAGGQRMAQLLSYAGAMELGVST